MIWPFVKPPYIQTYLGIRFQPLHPRVQDIYINDIAHHLSNQCRFSGATSVHYSVAQHSVYVSELVAHNGPEIELWGLLHDASEAYLVDLPSPIKRSIWFWFYRLAERRCMRAVCDRFDLPREMPEEVAYADLQLLATEVRDLLMPVKENWRSLLEPMKEKIVPWTPQQAETIFLDRFWAIQSRLSRRFWGSRGLREPGKIRSPILSSSLVG